MEYQGFLKIAGGQGNQIWERQVHLNVHRITVYNSQEMEAS